MIRYLVDTDIASDFLKRYDMALAARVRTALRANQVAISAVTRAELRYGQTPLPAEAARRRALIDAFLADRTAASRRLEGPPMGGVSRGVLAAAARDYGKPRPWLVVQADKYNSVDRPDSILVCLACDLRVGAGADVM